MHKSHDNGINTKRLKQYDQWNRIDKIAMRSTHQFYRTSSHTGAAAQNEKVNDWFTGWCSCSGKEWPKKSIGFVCLRLFEMWLLNGWCFAANRKDDVHFSYFQSKCSPRLYSAFRNQIYVWREVVFFSFLVGYHQYSKLISLFWANVHCGFILLSETEYIWREVVFSSWISSIFEAYLS